jgi:hypothetical protein
MPTYSTPTLGPKPSGASPSVSRRSGAAGRDGTHSGSAALLQSLQERAEQLRGVLAHVAADNPSSTILLRSSVAGVADRAHDSAAGPSAAPGAGLEPNVTRAVARRSSAGAALSSTAESQTPTHSSAARISAVSPALATSATASAPSAAHCAAPNSSLASAPAQTSATASHAQSRSASRPEPLLHASPPPVRLPAFTLPGAAVAAATSAGPVPMSPETSALAAALMATVLPQPDPPGAPATSAAWSPHAAAPYTGGPGFPTTAAAGPSQLSHAGAAVPHQTTSPVQPTHPAMWARGSAAAASLPTTPSASVSYSSGGVGHSQQPSQPGQGRYATPPPAISHAERMPGSMAFAAAEPALRGGGGSDGLEAVQLPMRTAAEALRGVGSCGGGGGASGAATVGAAVPAGSLPAPPPGGTRTAAAAAAAGLGPAAGGATAAAALRSSAPLVDRLPATPRVGSDLGSAVGSSYGLPAGSWAGMGGLGWSASSEAGGGVDGATAAATAAAAAGPLTEEALAAALAAARERCARGAWGGLGERSRRQAQCRQHGWCVFLCKAVHFACAARAASPLPHALRAPRSAAAAFASPAARVRLPASSGRLSPGGGGTPAAAAAGGGFDTLSSLRLGSRSSMVIPGPR